MSFGLKNAGVMYQQAVHLCFADQLHRNMEVYVEDLVIKTRNHDDFIADLEETFTHASSGGSSTRQSASLAYHWGNYSGLSSVIEELMPTCIKSVPSLTWGI
jgi:hypothetical protein